MITKEQMDVLALNLVSHFFKDTDIGIIRNMLDKLIEETDIIKIKWWRDESNSESLLMHAAKSGRADVVSLLIEKGAFIEDDD